MNRYLAPLVFSIALTAAQSFAKEPQAPPSPTAEGIGAHAGTVQERLLPGEEFPSSIYIGHYGELVKIHADWTVDPKMMGETEVIYFHPKFKDGLKRRQPYQPKQSDYTAVNFAPMRLMELVIIPKNAPGGLRSLEAIRRARESELKRNHVDFEMNSVSDDTTWPRETFHVQIKQPYRLWQIYSESAKEFYILTLGGPIKTGDYGLDENLVSNYNSADALLRESLSDYLQSVHKETLLEFLFKPLPADSLGFLQYLKIIAANTRYWIVLGALSLALMFLALWPGKSPQVRQANIIGRSIILFSVIMGIVGFSSVYIPIRCFGVAWRHSSAPELIPLLLVPWIAWLAAKSLGNPRPRYIFSWITLVASILAMFSFRANEIDAGIPGSSVAFANASLFLVLGIIFGIVFVLSLGPRTTKSEVR